MPKKLAPMTARIENFIRAEARGEPYEIILREQFGLTLDDDPKAINRAKQQMWRWRHRPDAKAIWEDELAARVRRRVPGAINRIEQQIDCSTDWLANKAANDIVTLAKSLGVIRSEETAINVQIQGMPEIGAPDQLQE